MSKSKFFGAVAVFLIMWTSHALAAPSADFSGSPAVWHAPATVNFTDKSVGSITNWSWKFGDGTQSTAKNPVHVYATPGRYTVELTVSALDGTDTQIKNSYIVVEDHIPTDDEYLIQIDSAALKKFGLYYPVTYKFKLPPGTTGLTAQYRHWEGAWHDLPEKKSSDIFNGIDAVRFDYAAGFAYVSVKFSRASESIYLRIIDQSGQPISVDFNSIPKYYDDRKAAVTFTLDDWTSWSDFEFRAASDYLGLYGLYFSVGLIVDGTPWSSIQQKIDKHGDQIEILSHSTHHSKDAAEYVANGYQTEVIGSRDEIRNHLAFKAHPYVPVYLEPWGYYDAIIDSLIASGDYLLSRGKFWSPIESTFTPWNATKDRYERVGYTFSDANNFDDANLLSQANAAFDDVLAVGGIYHLVNHPQQSGFWHDGSYLLQHLNHVKGRKDVWYTPFGPLYQYHFVQEMRGNLAIEHLGTKPLTADFSVSKFNGNAPLYVAFNDRSSGTVTARQWEFGDFTTSSEQNPVHVYADAGTYTVKLTVTGPGGVATSTRSNYIVVDPPSVSLTTPANMVLFAAPATISITAATTVATGVSVDRVDFYAGTTLVGSATASPYTFTWRNVSAGSYSLTARITDSQGASATSLPIMITVAGGALPTPWASRDIGNVGPTGSVGYLNGTFSLSGAGADIWGTADSFRYVYQPLTGDGQIIARVKSQQKTNDWAKAGVMIRENLISNSSHALMAVSPGNGAVFQRRLTAGGSSLNTFGPVVTAAYWVKLTRSGNKFSGYISSNGVNWVQVGSETMNMADTVYVGLAVTGYNRILGTANMNEVAVMGGTPANPPSVNITAPTDGATLAAPAAIPITATATAGTGATVSRVDFYAGTSLIGSVTASPYTVTWSNVPSGNYSLTARVTDSLNRTAVSSAIGITVTDSTLISPWTTRDIGSVGMTGSAGYLNGTFSLQGSGADIWGTADGFRYVYQPLTGDGEIIARVASLQNTNTWAKGGVMIRETLAANSSHVLMALTPGAGSAFQRRLTSGAISINTAGPRMSPPYWVKLVRSGSTFSGYVSSNGVNWTLAGSDTVSMAVTVYVGLAVTSHTNSALCTATMDGVSVTTGTPVINPTVSITLPTGGASFTAPATIALTATASAGTGATVKQVDFYAGSSLVGSATSRPYSIIWGNVPAGSYSLTARVIDTLNATATSVPVGIIVAGGALPAPWATRDIGTVGLVGSSVYQDGAFMVNGSGADIWGTVDGFRYVYKPLTGDGQIVARVVSQQNTNIWAKGGVMMRESLTANSSHVFMALTPGIGAAFQRRLTSGAISINTTGPRVSAPYWVKLVRSGNTFSGYVSSNGVTWTLVGSDTITMSDTVYIGLAVTSHTNASLCAVSMDGVQ